MNSEPLPDDVVELVHSDFNLFSHVGHGSSELWPSDLALSLFMLFCYKICVCVFSVFVR